MSRGSTDRQRNCIDGALAVACGLAALLLYGICLSPTVTYTGDCGELIAASYRGGVAHPSGYPLYCILARLFAVLPLGEVAWRYNLFSALCGAAAVGLIVLIMARLLPRNEQSTLWSAAGAALLLAGFTFFGAQCVIAEVYAPSGLLLAVILFCTIQWREQHDKHWPLLLALLLGLTFNSHLSGIFLWPGVLFYLWPQIKVLRVHRLAAMALLFLLGFSVTLYLPLRARTFPEPPKEGIAGQEYSWYSPLDWNHPVDFARWKTHVTVQQYRSILWKPLNVNIGGRVLHLRKLARTPTQAARKFIQLCGFLVLQFLWSTPLLLVGIVTALRRERRLGIALLIVCALNVGLAVHSNVDEIFYTSYLLFPTYLVLALWMGFGLHVIFRYATDKPRVLALCHVALIGTIVCQWILFVQASSFHSKTSARDLALERAEAALRLEQQTGRKPALFLLTDDTLFPFWYVQKVLGHAPNATTPWGQPVRAYQRLNRLPELVSRFQKRGPVAMANWDEKVDARFPYVPANDSGTLWLASTRALPWPSTPLTPAEEAALLDEIVKPRTRRLRKVRRAEVFGLNTKFQCPWFVTKEPWATDALNRTKQIGWIQIYIFQGGKPVSWKTTRRIVVTRDVKPGQFLQTMFPIELPIDLPPGQYEVWQRAVRWRGQGGPQIMWTVNEERLNVVVK